MYAFIFFFLPCHTSTLPMLSFFLIISIVSKFVNPYKRSLADCLDLEFLVWNPLPTAINRLSFLIIDEANEYYSKAK